MAPPTLGIVVALDSRGLSVCLSPPVLRRCQKSRVCPCRGAVLQDLPPPQTLTGFRGGRVGGRDVGGAVPLQPAHDGLALRHLEAVVLHAALRLRQGPGAGDTGGAQTLRGSPGAGGMGPAVLPPPMQGGCQGLDPNPSPPSPPGSTRVPITPHSGPGCPVQPPGVCSRWVAEPRPRPHTGPVAPGRFGPCLCSLTQRDQGGKPGLISAAHPCAGDTAGTWPRRCRTELSILLSPRQLPQGSRHPGDPP